MEDETEKIFKEQLRKLPKEVLNFILSTSWDTDADEIGSLYNLSEEELSSFKQEITLVLAGLVHPDEFGETLQEEMGITNRAVLEALVANVEKKIFAPIRPALISFFEKEAAENTEMAPIQEVESVEEAPASIIPTVQAEKVWEKEPDVVPDNLPVADESADSRLGRELFLIPPIPPKVVPGEEAIQPHPFEEKMKQVFTGGQQSMGDLAIEPAAPMSREPSVTPPVPTAPNVPPAPPIYHADPYREPIE